MPDKPHVMTVVSNAFEGDQAPLIMSAAIVSLVELCQMAMPNPKKIRDQLVKSGFKRESADSAQQTADMLALEAKLFPSPITDLRHELYNGERRDPEGKGEPIPLIFLLSEGRTKEGPIVMLSALFTGAAEADAVKAAHHITKAKPLTGAKAQNRAGGWVRRVVWDIPETAGVRFFVVSGPPFVDEMDTMRAFTAINKAR